MYKVKYMVHEAMVEMTGLFHPLEEGGPLLPAAINRIRDDLAWGKKLRDKPSAGG
jgi:hypothetical protein